MTPKAKVLRRYPKAYRAKLTDTLHHIRRGGRHIEYSGPLGWGNTPRAAWAAAAAKL
jgi:hypothetical protein